MFKNTIRSLAPFMDSFMFPNVESNDFYMFNSDCVLPAVMRRMLFDRKSEKKIFLRYLYCKHFDIESFFSCLDSNSLTICACEKEDYEKSTEFVDSKIHSQRNQKAELFIKKYTEEDTTIFVNPDKNSCLIFINNGDPHICLFHVVTSLLYILMPKTFSANDLEGSDHDDEVAMLRSLTSDRSSEFILNMSDKANSPAVKTYIVNCKFRKINHDGIQRQLNRIETSISDKECEICSFERKLIDAYADRKKFIEQQNILTIQLNTATEDTSLTEYLEKNSHVSFLNDDGDNDMRFLISGTLRNFDEEEYETYRMKGNFNAYVRDLSQGRTNVFSDPRFILMLMDHIFKSDADCLVNVAYEYQINFVDNKVRASSLLDLPEEYIHYIENPHLYHHGCLGNNSRFINDAIRNGDMITALEQCISSVQSVNVGETSATFIPFIRDLIDTKKSCIKYKDEYYTPEEVIKKIIESETLNEAD